MGRTPLPQWKAYQEQVACFFRALGLDATTDQTVDGVRTSHAVDVVVRSAHAGISLLWLVECKKWQRRVSQDRVLALRDIVADVGADRGFIMAENGYQKGALKSAYLTNVQLTSLADLQETCKADLAMVMLRHLFKRVDRCRDRYWALSKDIRIRYELRGDWDPRAYSGDLVIKALEAALIAASVHGFPVVYDELLGAMSAYSGSRVIEPRDQSTVVDAPETLVELVTEKLDELERRLALAESSESEREH